MLAQGNAGLWRRARHPGRMPCRARSRRVPCRPPPRLAPSLRRLAGTTMLVAAFLGPVLAIAILCCR